MDLPRPTETSPNNKPLIGRARAAMKAGDRNQARILLQEAIRQDLTDAVPWAYLAVVTTSPETSLKYARRAVRLDGDHPLVRKVNAWAEQRLEATSAPEVLDEPVVGDGPSLASDGPSLASDGPSLPSSDGTQRGRFNWQSVAVWGSIGVIVVVLVALASAFTWSAFSEPRRSATEVVASGTEPEAVTDVEDAPTDVPAEATPEADTATSTPTPDPPRIQAKNIASSDGSSTVREPRPTWTTTPTPTNTPVPTPTYVPTFVSPQNAKPVARPFGVGPDERWIDVDLTDQQLVAYEGNEPVFDTVISSGTWQHPTVTGQFRVWVRYRSQTMDGRRLGYDYYLENVPYVMYFFEDYALHGTFWHNNFGTPMSHGCVNLKTSDAEWIFNWSALSTVVNVHY